MAGYPPPYGYPPPQQGGYPPAPGYPAASYPPQVCPTTAPSFLSSSPRRLVASSPRRIVSYRTHYLLRRISCRCISSEG